MGHPSDLTANAERDPSNWVMGDERPTGPQISYLHTPAGEAGEEVPEEPTKAQASELIDRLQEKSAGRA